MIFLHGGPGIGNGRSDGADATLRRSWLVLNKNRHADITANGDLHGFRISRHYRRLRAQWLVA